MPEESRKKLSEVHPEEAFKSKEGKEVKSLEELYDELENSSPETFKEHVNENKNDYANWIQDSVEDEPLAVEMRKTTDLEQTKKIVKERIDELKKRVHMGDIIKKINSFNFQKTKEQEPEQQSARSKQPSSESSDNEINLGEDGAGEVKPAPMPTVPDLSDIAPHEQNQEQTTEGEQPTPQDTPAADSQAQTDTSSTTQSPGPSAPDLEGLASQEKSGEAPSMPSAPDFGEKEQNTTQTTTEQTAPNVEEKAQSTTQQEQGMPSTPDLEGESQQKAGEAQAPGMPSDDAQAQTNTEIGEAPTQTTAQPPGMPSAPDLGETAQNTQPSQEQQTTPEQTAQSTDAGEKPQTETQPTQQQQKAPGPSAPDWGGETQEKAGETQAPGIPSAPDLGEAEQNTQPSEQKAPSAPGQSKSQGDTLEYGSARAGDVSSNGSSEQDEFNFQPQTTNSTKPGRPQDMVNKLQSTYPYKDDGSTQNQETTQQTTQPQQTQEEQPKKKGLFKKLFPFKK